MSAKSPKTPIKIDLSGLKIKDSVNAEDVQIEQPSGAHIKKVNALKNLQYDMIKVEAQFYDELHELECKYAKLYEPFYEKRRQIILGEYEPTETEGKWALDEPSEEENKENVGEKKPATPVKQIQPIDESTLTESGKKLLNDLREQFKVNENGKEEKGIPHFWLETLQSFRMTAELIQEHDEPILEFLRDIRVKLFDKKPFGYTLEFYFDQNPYFTNKVLTKTYELKTEVDPKDPFSYEGPDLEKAIGCKIDWLPGKNTTVKLTKTKLKPKNKKGAVKTVTKEEKQDSFFTFFDTPKVTEKSDSKQIALRNEDHDDDEDETDEELYLMADFEIGQYIREKVVPKAVLFYTGEYDGLDEYDDDDEYDDEEDDDEEDEEDDDDEEEDDDDDDDDDEDHGKKGGKLAKKSAAKGGKPKLALKGPKGGEPTPSECKQN